MTWVWHLYCCNENDNCDYFLITDRIKAFKQKKFISSDIFGQIAANRLWKRNGTQDCHKPRHTKPKSWVLLIVEHGPQLLLLR